MNACCGSSSAGSIAPEGRRLRWTQALGFDHWRQAGSGSRGGRNRREAVERVLETLVAIGQANVDGATGKTFITR